MRNSDVAHKFFYQTGEYFSRSSMTTSFNDDTYYSYSTAIGKKITGKDGQDILLISDNTFSNTTAKHINELVYACPFGYENIIKVPQNMGNHYMELKTIIQWLTKDIDEASKLKMSQKANREYFNYCYETLKKLDDKVCDIDQSIFDQYTELYNIINDPKKLALEKQRQRQRDKEKQAKLKFELHSLLNNHSYHELIKFAFSDVWFNDYSVEEYDKQKELKSKLKQYLNPKKDLSFVWFDSNYCRTSQHITVDRKEAETLLKLWSKGKLKHGMKISYYTVLSVTDKYVQIGCHKIPAENMQALVDVMNTQKAA